MKDDVKQPEAMDADGWVEPDAKLEDLIDEDPGRKGQGGHWGWLLLVVALGFGAWIVVSGNEAETYFYTVDQALAQKDRLVGETFRIKGVVEEGTIVGEIGQLGRTFHVAEKGKSLRVSYDRALPDTFKEGMEVVVQGRLERSGTLMADEVLVKCPSRYEGQAPTAGSEGEESYPAEMPGKKG